MHFEPSQKSLWRLATLGIQTALIKLITIILAILFFFGLPFLLLALLPLYTYRYILGHTVQYFNGKFGKLLTARATIFAQDDLYSQPKFTLLLGTTLEGHVDVDTVIHSIQTKLIEKRLPDGQLKYPEMKQCVTPWGGFTFWKDAQDFEIKNHVEIYNPANLNNNNSKGAKSGGRFTHEDLKKLQQHLIEMPWVKGRPVWNFVLVNNYYPPESVSQCPSVRETNVTEDKPKTLLFMRCHHCLVDGFSSRCMLSEGLFGINLDSLESQLKSHMKEIKKSTALPFYYRLVIPFKCAYDAAALVLRVLQPAPWRPSEKEQNGKFHLTVGENVPLQMVKAIKTHYKVSFSSVVSSVIAGAIREMMIKKGVKVPEDIVCAMALPLPRPHMKLRNIMTGAYLSMPLGETDPVRRLRMCSNDYVRLKRSTIPVQTHWAFTFMGCLFNPWCKLISRNRYVPLVISNFVGGDEYFYVSGHKMEEAYFAVGPQLGSVGLSFWVMSYAGQFRISHTIEASVLNREEATQFSEEIQKQFHILLQNTQV